MGSYYMGLGGAKLARSSVSVSPCSERTVTFRNIKYIQKKISNVIALEWYNPHINISSVQKYFLDELCRPFVCTEFVFFDRASPDGSNVGEKCMLTKNLYVCEKRSPTCSS